MAEINKEGSAPAGSPEIASVPNPNKFDGMGGAPKKEGEGSATVVDEKQYKEMESLVGKQGEELGELRKFFGDITPILDKLNEDPTLVQAIVDGKITKELAQAVIEGKITIGDAKIVDKANTEVKKDLGKEAYKGASPEEISKLVEDKAEEIKKDYEGKFKERDEIDAFEKTTNDFINRTPDFKKYASKVDAWLDKNDVTDVSIAYYAVKGELSEEEATKAAEIAKAEEGKNAALNMGGGRSTATKIKDGGQVIDSLIAGKSNPNIF